MKQRTYTISVPENADILETVHKWLKKNRYKMYLHVKVRGLCEQWRYFKNDREYYVDLGYFDLEKNTIEFTITLY